MNRIHRIGPAVALVALVVLACNEDPEIGDVYGGSGRDTGACLPRQHTTGCNGDALYWKDACGNWTDLIENCEAQGKTCDPSSPACIDSGCTRNNDCPDSGCESWGECSGFSDECDTSGKQERSCWTYECSGGQCNKSEYSETQDCQRTTDGTTCAGDGTCQAGICIGQGDCSRDSDCDARACTDWGTCGDYAEVCTEQGVQHRTCYTPKCNTSTRQCEYTSRDETQACTGRDTDGTTCGSPQTGNWSACGGFSDDCDESGTQSRTVTTYTCAGGSCRSNSSTDSQNCSRDTDGDNCGSETCGSWSACEFSDICDESGTQTQTCTSKVCESGTCQTKTTTNSRSCTRDTDGNSCGSETCGGWSTCSGFSDTCDESGTQTQTCTSKVCGSGTCQTKSTTNSRSCSRDTDGISCGGTTCGDWSSCTGFSDNCDESGTQTQTCTSKVCGSGSCQTKTNTESQSCTRNTYGDWCRESTVGTWGPCGGFSDVCDETGIQTAEEKFYECRSGSCVVWLTGTTSQSCTRNTDGISCSSIADCKDGTCSDCYVAGGGSLGSGTDCDPSSPLIRAGVVKYHEPHVWSRGVDDRFGCSVDPRVVVSGFSGNIDIGMWYLDSSGMAVDVSCAAGSRKTSLSSSEYICERVPCCVSNSLSASSETVELRLPTSIGDGSGTFYVSVMQRNSGTPCSAYSLRVEQY